MKHIILFCLSMAALASIAQTCQVSGAVNDASIKEVYLFLLEGDTYFESPSVKIPVLPNRTFSTKVSVPNPVFARLTAGNKGQRLIISTGRDVKITFDSALNMPNIITGKGTLENHLINSSVLTITPSFIKQKWTATALTPDNWNETIMKPVEQDIATTTNRIQQANIPANLKEMLICELQYAYQCYLHDLTANYLRWSKHPNSNTFLDSSMHWKPLPDSQMLVSGFYANMILDKQCRYTTNSFAKNKDRQEAKEALAAYLQMPLDSIIILSKTYNETAIISWLYARLHMPVSLRDKILYNHIKNAASDGSLQTCTYLFNILQENFPQSSYLTKVKSTMQGVEYAINNNTSNKRIVFNNAIGIQSLEELVAPYKGKIVYLDIWGTWCGPCKQEMVYAPELKKRYAGKDVVFVYLDKDEALKEIAWKELVYHAALEGEHYRMNEQAIERIWKAVQEAGGKTYSYPTYLIIGKDGKIINADAERPGSREKIYAQLDKVL